MVDLSEAGHRLASEVFADVPPVSEVERRSRRRTRGRRIRAGSAAALIVAIAAIAAVVAVSGAGSSAPHQHVVVGPPPGRPPVPPVTLPAVAHPAGSIPVDYGQVRLWLPPGWSAAPAGTCAGYHRQVYFGSFGAGSCFGSVVAFGSWLAVHAPTAPPPAGSARTVINGTTVWSWSRSRSPSSAPTRVYDVPSLGVEITAVGAASRAVAETLGPSSLHAVLAEHYPAAVPASWKTVAYDGFKVSVPAGWPTHTITAHQVVPWACGPVTFAVPTVQLGYGAPVRCPFTNGSQTPTKPSDGLWLQPPGPTSAHGLGPGQAAKVITSGPVRVTVVYTPNAPTNAQEMVTAGGRTMVATVGLGVDPAVAEQILSSFRT